MAIGKLWLASMGAICSVTLASQVCSVSRAHEAPASFIAAEHGQPDDDLQPVKTNNGVKHRSLIVAVLTKSTTVADADSPVAGATVTLFAGEYRASGKTNAAGTVSFSFETEAKSATVRVVAERFRPDQRPVALKADSEQRHTVMLTQPAPQGVGPTAADVDSR